MNPNLLKQINEAESLQLKIHLAVTGLTADQIQQLWSYLQEMMRG